VFSGQIKLLTNRLADAEQPWDQVMEAESFPRGFREISDYRTVVSLGLRIVVVSPSCETDLLLSVTTSSRRIDSHRST
jgi:hypothetical protein